MQTGEGKTLAAVPAVAWLARGGRGVHVLTANDYLAARDADVDARDLRAARPDGGGDRSAHGRRRRAAPRIARTSPTRPRTRSASTTCATGSRFDLDEQVHRPFRRGARRRGRLDPDRRGADSARDRRRRRRGRRTSRRTPTAIVRELVPGRHFTVDGAARNVALTPAGVTHVERAIRLRQPVRDVAHLAAAHRGPGRAARARAAPARRRLRRRGRCGPAGRRVQGPDRARSALAGGPADRARGEGRRAATTGRAACSDRSRSST